MRISGFIGLTALAVLSAPAAQAASPDGQFSAKGAGLATCQAYLDARSDGSNAYAAAQSWLNGFISAYNLSRENTYDVAPMHNVDQLGAALARICEKGPDTRLVVAAHDLVRSLYPARTTRQSKPVRIERGDQTYAIPANLLRRVQGRLRDLGYYDGPIDAKYGPGTRTALEAFQDRAGLDSNGLPGQATVLELMRTES